MGRAFEYRKARKLKRWGNMSRTFTRIGKEITIAAKSGGPDPDTNPRLRVLMQNAKAANMPKDTVERAIKESHRKDSSDYKEIVYEGYGPYGIAIVVEAATDNNTRTVANVRSLLQQTRRQPRHTRLTRIPFRPQERLQDQTQGRNGSRRTRT